MRVNYRRQRRELYLRTIAAKRWLWIVVIAVLASSAVYVGTMRNRIPDDATTVRSAPAVAMGKPAQTTVIYTVGGPAGADATLAYLQPDGPVERVVAPLPWSISLRTTHLAPAASVLAQSVAKSISCAISVDGLTVIAHQSARDFAPVDCTLPAT